MSASPRVAESARLSLEITIDGTSLPASCGVVEIVCTKEVNRIPTARIDILDGSLSGETFKTSEQAMFAPGKRITIAAGYAGKTATIFVGVVTRHAIKVRRGRRSLLSLTCHDEASKLTAVLKSCQYTKMSDTTVVRTLIQDCGLKADVDLGTTENAQMVRYASSDWDYIVLRAEALGRVVIVDDGTISVKKPAFAASALVLTHGESLSDADLELDARTQVVSVGTTSWDPKTQHVVAAKSSEPTINTQSDIAATTLAAVLDKTDALMTAAALDADGLKTWADAELTRRRLARVKGSATFHGSASAKVGTLVTLKGVGKRLDGDAYVSRVTHRLEPNVWRTEVGFGLSASSFASPLGGIGAPAAAGLAPAAHGLQIAKVLQTHEDPDGAYRVKVKLPLVTASDGLWARFASAYAGKAMGIQFLPEVDDEVVVGFLGGDPSAAVVLGSFHSGGRAAPYTPDEKNTFKAIVTASKMKLWFDDQKKVVCLETPGGHTITMSDEGTSVTILDSNKNKIVLDKSGIKATSQGDFVVDVVGSVKLSGKRGIVLDTPADLSGKGANVAMAATLELTAKGQVSAQLTSPVQAVVKGAMVMIN